MISIGLKELLDAGVHFGHQTKRWNPKMKPFIFDARNGIHIIDLSKTLSQLDTACNFLSSTIAKGGKLLFVGTNKQAQQAVKDRIAALGTTLISVNPGQQRGFGVAIAGGQQKLTIGDAKAIEERATTLLAVQPEMGGNQQVVYANKNANTSIVGTTANYLEVRKYKLEAGRMFTNAEDEGKQRVAVVGLGVPQNMGGKVSLHARDIPFTTPAWLADVDSVS